MTNIVPFPGKRVLAFGGKPRETSSNAPRYEFTPEELDELCRWYSAMKYAFPQAEAVMTVCHRTKVSALGIYGAGGRMPNCLISKHEAQGSAYLLWATEQDAPRLLENIGEITRRQIRAIDPPPDEARWMDLTGWTTVFSNRTEAYRLHGV
jgi:hypothetical protein